MKKNSKSEYGEILTRIIKDKNITQQEFYSQLGIKKPYFYDIVSGKVNPPPPETQIKIVKILNLSENETRSLLDIAAKARNEMPADIGLYLKYNLKELNRIRSSKGYKEFIDKGEK